MNRQFDCEPFLEKHDTDREFNHCGGFRDIENIWVVDEINFINHTNAFGGHISSQRKFNAFNDCCFTAAILTKNQC